MNYYPVFLNLTGKKAVVIGGGKIAERKILNLMSTGAEIIVISPVLSKRLQKEKEKNRFRHVQRKYRKNDLQAAFLVIAATDSPEINSLVAHHAQGLVNVVDVPSECNFIAPSVVRRGPFILAISTSGTSPAFASTIRSELETLYGPEISAYLRFVKKIRIKAMAKILNNATRETFLKGLASTERLHLLREKGLDFVRKSVEEEFRAIV